jgi:hypothetical protein
MKQLSINELLDNLHPYFGCLIIRWDMRNNVMALLISLCQICLNAAYCPTVVLVFLLLMASPLKMRHEVTEETVNFELFM